MVTNGFLLEGQKPTTPSKIPLLPISYSIVNKYVGHPLTANSGKLLPIMSNQRMNAYLKELADLCGIPKELTFHCARHTFATTVTLTNGVPIETVRCWVIKAWRRLRIMQRLWIRRWARIWNFWRISTVRSFDGIAWQDFDCLILIQLGRYRVIKRRVHN